MRVEGRMVVPDKDGASSFSSEMTPFVPPVIGMSKGNLRLLRKIQSLILLTPELITGTY